MNELNSYVLEMISQTARLEEKVGKLETLLYGILAFALLQLGGLFVLWAKHTFEKKQKETK